MYVTWRIAQVALLCFDVDGTLEQSEGPIPLQALHDLSAQGHLIVIVSPSPLRPKNEPFPEFLSVDRRKNLRDARQEYPHEQAVYISDNDGDDVLSSEVDFEYVHPVNWDRFLAKLNA
ncbi:MAG: hypothetical protein IIC22_00925 [Chloroflexi bacterium]|nr:hypothetical protein [Chloroflexota bacterium]